MSRGLFVAGRFPRFEEYDSPKTFLWRCFRFEELCHPLRTLWLGLLRGLLSMSHRQSQRGTHEHSQSALVDAAEIARIYVELTDADRVVRWASAARAVTTTETVAAHFRLQPHLNTNESQSNSLQSGYLLERNVSIYSSSQSTPGPTCGPGEMFAEYACHAVALPRRPTRPPLPPAWAVR